MDFSTYLPQLQGLAKIAREREHEREALAAEEEARLQAQRNSSQMVTSLEISQNAQSYVEMVSQRQRNIRARLSRDDSVQDDTESKVQMERLDEVIREIVHESTLIKVGKII